jgi:undecaprenyl diphosphate synthase
MTFETKHNTNGILNLAINYSGRLEIIEGIKQLAKEISNNTFDINNICEETFPKFLFHPDLPDPDLLIRTSGEKRISNFLLWQIAYTELYFTDILWPEFSKQDFINAIIEYQKRERRFGGHI